jgi:hypothetical protein
MTLVRTVLLSTCACALAAASAAQAQSTCQIAGRYGVVGRIPGAIGSYKGEALISANATGCYMRWFPPNDSEGTGTYSSGVLTIYFTFANGGSGVVRYERAPNGEFHGVWSMNANPSAQGGNASRALAVLHAPLARLTPTRSFPAASTYSRRRRG